MEWIDSRLATMTTERPLPAPARELIGRRYSCRTYLDRPVSAGDQARLLDFMATRTTGPFGAQARFGLLAAAPDDPRALRRLGTYGFIKGATGFIVGAVRRAPKDLEDYGYLLEEIVLFATGMGLGTCWLGGTFTRSTFVRRFGGLARGETMPAVLSLGHIGDDGRGRIRAREEGDRRLPAGELFFADRDWHFLLRRTKGYGGAAFKLVRIADLQRVDLGIAMCHFTLVAREAGLDGQWVIDDPGLDLPAGVEYTATWRGRG